MPAIAGETFRPFSTCVGPLKTLGILYKIIRNAALYVLINNHSPKAGILSNDHQGDYSTIFTEPEVNNCSSIILELNNRE